jgi:hypothetical protein
VLPTSPSPLLHLLPLSPSSPRSYFVHPSSSAYIAIFTLTRSEAKAAFDHILNEVLGRNDTSNLKRGLLAEGISDIFDLSSLDDGFIDYLEYHDPKDPDLTLNCVKGDKMLVKCFLAYMVQIEQTGFTGDYMSITQASFDQFRISPANKTSSASAANANFHPTKLIHIFII